MKKNKINVLFINQSEYTDNKIKIIKNFCTVYNLENPNKKINKFC